MVQRAGDVIPEVVKVMTSRRTGTEMPFRMPATCPVCRAEVIQEAGETAVRCVNSICPAQVKERIKHFASKGAFDIEGLGSKLVEQLVDKGLVQHFADIFRLNQENLQQLERMGPKSAQNLLEAITQTKSIGLSRFIYALGIRHVGEYVAHIIAKAFQSLERIAAATKSELEAIEGVGPKVADSLVVFFNHTQNNRIVGDLLAAGIQITPEAHPPETEKLDGMKFVITGTLDSMPRRQIKKTIEKLGGSVTSTVSKKTDFLVAGRVPGSKMKKAKALGVKIIDESELVRMLSSTSR